MIKTAFPAVVVLLSLIPLVAQADVEAGKRKSAVCAACHGADGNSPTGAFPILAGQTARYIYLQLKDFKEGRRKDPSMDAMVGNLSREDMLDLADYFAAQKPKPLAFKADSAKVAKGSAKANEVLCTMCHLGGFAGQNEIPRVAGQYPEYIVKQLQAFKARTRTNDAGNMTSVARTLTEEDIENLSHFIANLN
ncbi:MAG TPA: c-type cytochrome [Acidiferrobacterales bacterium]|nr:c-type cytochrome [Acidiferrobacterales bacterium]